MEQKKYGEIIFTHEQIVQACKEMALKLNKTYQNSKLVTLVGVLKGAVPFMAELIKHLSFDMRIDFITATSYKDNKSSGELKMVMDLSHSIVDHDLLIIEDICDSGLTLSKLTNYLKNKKPKSIRSAVLINKPAGRKIDFDPDWVGLTVDKVFLVGFGFDDHGYLRNLPFIAKAKDA